MEKLVTVAAFTGPVEAHLAKGRLESEGVPVVLADEHHVTSNWVFSNALGGIKIQVAAEHAAKAQVILQQLTEGYYEAALLHDFPDLEENECPSCGSKEYKSRMPLWLLGLVILTLGLASIIFPIRQNNHVCLKCRYQWKH